MLYYYYTPLLLLLLLRQCLSLYIGLMFCCCCCHCCCFLARLANPRNPSVSASAPAPALEVGITGMHWLPSVLQGGWNPYYSPHEYVEILTIKLSFQPL